MAGVEIPDESIVDTSMIEEQEGEDDDYSISSHPGGVARQLDPTFQQLITPHEAVDLPLPPSPAQASTSRSISPVPTQAQSSSPNISASLDPRNNENTGLAEAPES